MNILSRLELEMGLGKPSEKSPTPEAPALHWAQPDEAVLALKLGPMIGHLYLCLGHAGLGRGGWFSFTNRWSKADIEGGLVRVEASILQWEHPGRLISFVVVRMPPAWGCCKHTT